MRHLYVHVPFCRRRCTYCDFSIAVRNHVPADRFVDDVVREVRSTMGSRRDEPADLRTLYLGGGTPSLLPDAALARLLDFVRQEIGLAPGAEITIEANPDDVAPDRVDRWVGMGINRVSLGVQSVAPDVLGWMHRTHEAGDGLEAARLLKAGGIASLSVDLIFGLPDRLGSSPLTELDAILDTGPDHVSAYGLTVEPSAALAKWERRGVRSSAPSDRFVEEFLGLDAALTEVGFDHYEVSNYARPGHRSRHNGAYWSDAPYLGLGPSAHSYDGQQRWWNVRHWAEYDQLVQAGVEPRAEVERLTPEQVELERIYLGLRTAEGVGPVEADGLGERPTEQAIESGWLRRDRGRLRPTPSGWLRLDELVAALTTSGAGG